MSPIRVLVVDDSVVVRKLVTDSLSSDPNIEVVATAANGKISITKWTQLKPDAITMDIEMPVMDGIEAVRRLRQMGCKVPIIMFSTLTERGATATLDALSAGATDYVTKPANVGSVQEAQASVRDQLVPIICGLVPGHRIVRSSSLSSSRGGSHSVPILSTSKYVGGAIKLHDRTGLPNKPVRLVILGSSTGGPEALSRVVKGINRPLPVPMIVTQHMPPVFTAQLAARLDRLGPSTVHEAKEGQVLAAGNIYIAPGDFHLELAGNAGGARVRLTKTPPVNFCRPSVDVMFKSAVGIFKGEMLGVVLTGMGQDGREGCRLLIDQGGRTLVQDEHSSVVWGMPGAVASAGLADTILPIDDIASAIIRTVETSQERR